VGEAEEVEGGHRDARLGRVAVEHLEHDAAQLLRRRRQERHPEVAEDAAAPDVGEHDPLIGVHPPVRWPLAAAVCGAAGTSGAARVLERDRAAVEPAVDECRVFMTSRTLPSSDGRRDGTPSRVAFLRRPIPLPSAASVA
jgi:hypothetical protein